MDLLSGHDMSRLSKQPEQVEGRIALRIPGPLMARFLKTYGETAGGIKQYTRYTQSDHWRYVIERGIFSLEHNPNTIST